MRVSVEHTENGTLATLAGPLDGIALASDRSAGEMLSNASSQKLTVDLKDVPFLDTSGVGFLVQILKRTRMRAGECLFENVSGQPADLLTALGLADLFGLKPTVRSKDARGIILAATTTDSADKPIAALSQAA